MIDIKTSNQSLLSILEISQRTNRMIPYEGFPRDDDNIPGNILIVHILGSIYSFPKKDILESEPIRGGQVRVWIRGGAKAFYMRSFIVGSEEAFTVGMEDVAPPPMIFDPNAPSLVSSKPGTDSLKEALVTTLAGAMSAYNGTCTGGDSFDNNCAHFLSDAFIRSGFSELHNNNTHINARCSPARRPIRARDMWSWFQSKARRTSRVIARNTGIWAIFQINESEYWGGHVVLLNSDTWNYSGTGWYGQWDQYLYQW